MSWFTTTEGVDPESLGAHIEFGANEPVGPVSGDAEFGSQQVDAAGTIGAPQEDDPLCWRRG